MLSNEAYTNFRVFLVTGSRLLAALFLTAALAFAAPVWRQVNGPGFTVLTSDSPTDAEAIARDYQQFMQSLSKIIPVETERLPPLTVIMMPNLRDFRPYRPLDPEGKPRNVGGLFLRDVSWATSVIVGDWRDDVLRHIIQHEGVHWLLSNINIGRDLWLEEGLAEVFATAKRKQDRTIIGYPLAGHVHFLREYGLMSLARLMEVKRNDPEYNESARVGRFYATSWALVHYVLCGQHQIPRSALNTYIQSARRMERPAAFAHAFGMGYTEMQDRLESYLVGGKFNQYAMEEAGDNVQNTIPLETVPAKPATVEAAFAKLATKVEKFSLAEKHIGAIRTLDPESVTADELEGYLALQRRDYTIAEEKFARAAAKGSRDFGVYFWPASFRVFSTTPEPAVGAAREPKKLQLSAMAAFSIKPEAPKSMDDPRRVANQFKRAINLQPLWRLSYVGLAATISHLPSLHKTDYDFLLAGARVFPEELSIWLGIAHYEYKDGRRESARERLSQIIQAAGLSNHDKILEPATRLAKAWDYSAVRDQVIDALNAGRVEEARAAFDQLSKQNAGLETVADLKALQRRVERAEAAASEGKGKNN